MQKQTALDSLAALSQETRLDAFRLLVQAAPGGMAAGDIAARLGVLQNTMSGHLAALAGAGLVTGTREGRTVRYAVDVDRVRALFGFLLEDCCGGRPEICDLTRSRDALPFDKMWAAGRIFNVLFICTANSARSILAEAIVNHDHGTRFRAYSAGSQPAGAVSPDTLAVLRRLGYPTERLRSKGWGEFTRPDAPRMDFILTVCDSAANERCPVWRGAPMSALWAVPDPKAVIGNAATRRNAYSDAFHLLERRIGAFASLPFASLSRAALKQRIEEIGASEGPPALG